MLALMSCSALDQQFVETEEIGEMHCRIARMLLEDVDKKTRDFRYCMLSRVVLLGVRR